MILVYIIKIIVGVLRMEPIILASSSLRRQEILKELNIPFSIVPDYSPEVIDEKLSPKELAENLAIKKIKNAINLTKDSLMPWFLGADTLITLNGKIFGKPNNRNDAYKMIKAFSGQTHTVITAIALWSPKTHELSTSITENQVTFATMTEKEIEYLLDTGEWQGVAGGYRIQEHGSFFITEIKGSYSSIVGLPIRELYAILSEQGYSFE